VNVSGCDDKDVLKMVAGVCRNPFPMCRRGACYRSLDDIKPQSVVRFPYRSLCMWMRVPILCFLLPNIQIF